MSLAELTALLDSTIENRVAAIEKSLIPDDDRILFDPRDLQSGKAKPVAIIAADYGWQWFIPRANDPDKCTICYGVEPPPADTVYAKFKSGDGRPQKMLLLLVVDFEARGGEGMLRLFQSTQVGIRSGFIKLGATAEEANRSILEIDGQIYKIEKNNKTEYGISPSVSSLLLDPTKSNERLDRIKALYQAGIKDWGVERVDLTRFFTGNGIGGVIPRLAKTQDPDNDTGAYVPEEHPHTASMAHWGEVVPKPEVNQTAAASIPTSFPETVDYMKLLQTHVKNSKVLKMVPARAAIAANKFPGKVVNDADQLLLIMQTIIGDSEQYGQHPNIKGIVDSVDWIQYTAWDSFLVKLAGAKKEESPMSQLLHSQGNQGGLEKARLALIMDWGIMMGLTEAVVHDLYANHPIAKIAKDNGDYATALQSFVIDCLSLHPKAATEAGSMLIEAVDLADPAQLIVSNWPNFYEDVKADNGALLADPQFAADLLGFIQY